MLFLLLVLLQLALFVGLIFFIRVVLARHLTSATTHLNQLNQDYTQKEEHAKKRMEDAERYYDETFVKAKTAAEAVQVGLVNQVVPDDQLAAATKKLADKLAGLPTRAIGLTKRAINAAWRSDLATQLDYEAMLQTTAGQTHDHREGVMAFLEKRPARFRGE